VKTRKAAGEIRRMVAMDGHEGPKEIGVGPNFLASWETRNSTARGLSSILAATGKSHDWLMDNRNRYRDCGYEEMKPEILPPRGR